MICPLCQHKLTKIKGDWGTGFECRKGYIYLAKDYPVCHYAYRIYTKVDKEEIRYLLLPFIVYSYPKGNYSKLSTFFKEGEMIHHGIKEIKKLPFIEANSDNADYLINKFNIYLTFL